MIVASVGFHLMIYLFVMKQYVFIIFMFDIIFHYIVFDSLGCFTAFVIVFYVRVHFAS